MLFVDDMLLFREASIEQAHCIMNFLDVFGDAFGQKY